MAGLAVVPKGLALWKVEVERTKTASGVYWVLAETKEEAQENAIEAFDAEEHLIFYEEEDTDTWITPGGPNRVNPQMGPVEPGDGEEILWDGKVLNWPLPREEELIEHLEIQLSIHPDQGQLL